MAQGPDPARDLLWGSGAEVACVGNGRRPGTGPSGLLTGHSQESAPRPVRGDWEQGCPFRRVLTIAGTLPSPRSPEPSKTPILGTEDGIEPVSPPEGMSEPGHPRSAVYPLLYRDGEPAEPRCLAARASPSLPCARPCRVGSLRASDSATGPQVCQADPPWGRGLHPHWGLGWQFLCPELGSRLRPGPC